VLIGRELDGTALIDMLAVLVGKELDCVALIETLTGVGLIVAVLDGARVLSDV
jgi:hypothetical protein